MSPLGKDLVRDVPTVRASDPLLTAIETLVETGLPALPVCDDDGKLVGVFGERDVITAILPGYVGELTSAAFLSSILDDALEERLESGRDPVSKYMNTEHVEVPADFSYAQLAETFLHHRVSVIPVVEDRRVVGAVTRRDYVNGLAERLGLAAAQPPEEPAAGA
jgi:CBS domain-containing protein